MIMIPTLIIQPYHVMVVFPSTLSITPYLFSSSGAGSCLEALGAGKPLLVVVNDKLMNNHQLEMARQLHMDSHLLYCTCRYVCVNKCTVYKYEVV